MSSVYAFIVGIERYDQPDWDISGPCANALAVAEWCLVANVPPRNIFLFVEALDADCAMIAKIKAKGVNVEETAEWDAIDKFWRTRLAKDRPAGEQLLVYWSGHGFTDNDGTRILICRDYRDPNLKNRVFNASNFLRHLRGAAFQCFRQQLFVADVCANYTTLDFAPDQSDPGIPVKTIEQASYFATPEGEYAKGDDGRGVFTNIVVSVLREFDGWPELSTLSAFMNDAFKKVGETPFHIEVSCDPTHEAFTRTVGTIPTNSRSPLFKSVLSLLAPLALPDTIFRRHYLRTVDTLGEPKLTQAQGLSGMLKELTSLRDSDLEEGVSFGLLQFLVRLCQEEEVAPTISSWLDENASHRGNDRSNVDEIIKAEAQEKLLIVDVLNDDEGRVSEFQSYLRTQNLHPIEDKRLVGQKVKDWDDFEAKILALIKSLRSPPAISGFQIQFLIDPPLFDRAFHMITRSGGAPLGEEYVVLLRNRERIFNAPNFVRDSWNRYADALRQTPPGDLKLIPIPAPAAEGSLPDEMGFCYANFILQPSAPGVSCIQEKRLMGKLMRKGIPYLYWLHSIPPGGALAELEHVFGTWLKEVKTLDQFPSVFTAQRNGNQYALQASLLWDDPQFNPFSMSVRSAGTGAK